MLFWLPAVLVLLVTALLAYLVKKQLEARLEPLLIFNTLQQIIGILIALAVGLFALAYKALNTKINDGNEGLLDTFCCHLTHLFLECC